MKNVLAGLISMIVVLSSITIGATLYTFHNIMLSTALTSNGMYVSGTELPITIFGRKIPYLKYARCYLGTSTEEIEIQYPFLIIGRKIQYIYGEEATYKIITIKKNINGKQITIEKKIARSIDNEKEFSEIDVLFQKFSEERRGLISLQ